MFLIFNKLLYIKQILNPINYIKQLIKKILLSKYLFFASNTLIEDLNILTFFQDFKHGTLSICFRLTKQT